MQQLSFLPGEMTPGERSLILRALKMLLVGYFWNNFHLVPIQILSFLGFWIIYTYFFII